MGTPLNAAPEEWKESPQDAKSVREDVDVSVVSADDQKTADRSLSFGGYNMNIDEVYRDIKRLTLTKNPLDLIFKANEIREKFAFFINSLALFISQSFSFENKSFSDELYHDARYHEVWMELAGDFFRDMRYCDPFLGELKDPKTLLNVDPLDLARKAESDMLKDEDFANVRLVIEHLIKIYRKKDDVSELLDRHIASRATEKREGFARTSVPARKEAFIEAIRLVAESVPDFPYEKETFLERADAIVSKFELSDEERTRLFSFAFQRIVDTHYPDVKHIFFDTNLPYGTNQTFLTKHSWLKVKWKNALKSENIDTEENRRYFSHVLNCKNLILELEASILSPILLPIILKLVASSMCLRRKDFKKFSYILLFLFANSYENEYIPLSRFLNELEVYINYKNEKRVLEKLKIGFSLIVLFALFVFLGYFLLPSFVFVAGTILIGIYLKMYFVDDYAHSANIGYNLWTKLWAVIILAVFGYTWLTNIGAYADYYGNLKKRLDGMGQRIVAEIVPPEQIAREAKNASASILEWNARK